MNAESEMRDADGLGGEPVERPGQAACRELAEEIGYSDGSDDDETGGVDALIDYKNALEDRYCEAVDALHALAAGVPMLDEWRSAADFMEYAAATLDRVPIARPDHYPED